MGYVMMEGAEANFSEPVAFKLTRKDDYKRFQLRESKGRGNRMSQCRNILLFLASYTLIGRYL